MMKIILMGSLVLLSGCSNMTIGFEEESIFYTPPKEVVVEQEVAAEKVEVKDTPQIVPVTQKDTIAPIITIKPDKVISQKTTPRAPVVIKEKDPENETTFSYDPYDGE